ncbi:MAG: hypothetical protein LBR08_09760 [Bacteroidales bacterium]|jgi:hypothetical protein|nr:hypothetical protein [Bacteroidales bacterium]
MKRILKGSYIVAMACSACWWCGCKKSANVSFAPEETVTDLAQTYLYYSMIFREAEHAWALIDHRQYPAEPVTETGANGAQRIFTWVETEEGKPELTVEYRAWTWGTATLAGKLTMNMPGKDLYRESGKTATVNFTGFSINRQNIAGYANITRAAAGDDGADRYNYSFNNSSIYDETGQQVIIASTMTNGSLTRVEGGDTHPVQEDDTWSFTGSMSGTLRNNISLKYSNAVSEPLFYEWACGRKAMKGRCTLTVNRQEIIYDYGASCNSQISIGYITK